MQKVEKSIVFNTRTVAEATDKLERGIILKPRENPWFEGNIGIRKANVAFAPTALEQEEYIACYYDILEFAKKCRIKSEDGTFKPLSLRDYQIEMLETIQSKQKTIIMASRQCGKCCDPLTEITIKKDYIAKTLPFYKLWYLENPPKTFLHKLRKLILDLMYLLK